MAHTLTRAGETNARFSHAVRPIMKIHPSFANIGLSKIVQVSERARVLAPEFEKRTGTPFIYFQRGEVGYPVPAFMGDALREAVEKGLTKYPKAGGEGFYKHAVLKDLEHRGISGLGQEHIVAAAGGQEGLELVFAFMRGRTCAGFTPCWSCMFDNIFPYTETTFIQVPLRAELGWSIDFAALEATLPLVDTFYFNSPHNPTGRVFTRADIERVCGLCAKYGVLMVCDEAYKDLAFSGEHYSPLQDERNQNLVVINTFSKGMAATGFRVGYIASRRTDLIDFLTRGEYSQTAGVPTPIQYACAKALEHPKLAEWMKGYRAEMKARAVALADNLDPRLGAHAPEGAFYCFINLAPPGLGEAALTAHETSVVERLLSAGIAVVPGSAFGKSFAGYVRLSFSTLEPAVIAQGARRFNTVVLG
ncbi:MAG: pyridoxal phosphate-dependent aminotransferase [Phycisphaerales bacterium]